MHQFEPLDKSQLDDRLSFTKSGKRRIVRRMGRDEKGRPILVSLSPVNVLVI